mgnify:CR=1 FL=1
MAKKSSTNAVDKINEQIKDLEKSKKKIDKDDDVIPVFDRKKLNDEIKKKSSNSKNKNSYKKSNKKIRDNVIVNDKKYKNNDKDNDKTIIRDKIITVDSKKKNIDKLKSENKNNSKLKKEEGLTEEETLKLKNLEEEMRDLYSSEEFSKTKKINTISSNKNSLKNIESRIDEKLDDVSLGLLNKTLYILLVIFCTLFLMFILFIVFISTF